MKKCITVTYDELKLLALRQHAEQRGISVEAELAQAAESMYQKLVPATVKAFVQMQTEAMSGKKEKKKSASSVVDQGSEEAGN